MIGFSLKKTIVFTLLVCLFGFQSCFLQKNVKQEEVIKEKAVLENEESVFDFSELNKKLLKTEEAKTEEEMRYINLITDFDGKNIRIGISEADTSWNILNTPAFGNNAYYLGILNVDWNAQPHSNLKLLSLNLPMTTIAMMEARSPADVKINAEEINKLAIVEGYSSGGMIYKARIVAVFNDKPMELLMKLLQKNEITPYLKKNKND